MPTQQPPGNWKNRWVKSGRLCWGWCPAPTWAAKPLSPAREQGRGSEAGDGVSGTRRYESRCFWPLWTRLWPCFSSPQHPQGPWGELP